MQDVLTDLNGVSVNCRVESDLSGSIRKVKFKNEILNRRKRVLQPQPFGAYVFKSTVCLMLRSPQFGGAALGDVASVYVDLTGLVRRGVNACERNHKADLE